MKTNLNEFSFEWLSLLKHSYEKKVVLKNGDENDQTGSSFLRVNPFVLLYYKFFK